MKKTIIEGFIALAIMLILCGIPALIYFLVKSAEIDKMEKNMYPETMIVKEVKNDLVTIETANGALFQFEGAEDWEVGDICSCIMDSKGTAIIYDDEIVKTKYSGWLIK